MPFMKIVRTERYWGIIPAKSRIVLFPGYIEEIQMPSRDGSRGIKRVTIIDEQTVRYEEEVSAGTYKAPETHRPQTAFVLEEKTVKGRREVNGADIRGEGKSMGSKTVIRIKATRF
jgi:hypothetical protein